MPDDDIPDVIEKLIRAKYPMPVWYEDELEAATKRHPSNHNFVPIEEYDAAVARHREIEHVVRLILVLGAVLCLGVLLGALILAR